MRNIKIYFILFGIYCLCTMTICSQNDPGTKVLLLKERKNLALLYDIDTHEIINLGYLNLKNYSFFTRDNFSKDVELTIYRDFRKENNVEFGKAYKYAIDKTNFTCRLKSLMLLKNTEAALYVDEIIKNGNLSDTISSIVREKYKHPKINSPIYYESALINGIQIVMDDGDLYLKRNDTIELFIKYDRSLKPKNTKEEFGGFDFPALSYDAKKVLFIDRYRQLVPDTLISSKRDNFLVEMVIDTKEKQIFKFKHSFRHPRYSINDKFVLFAANFKYYVLNLKDGEIFNLPRGFIAYWLINN